MLVKSRVKDYEVCFSRDFQFVQELKDVPNKLVIVDKNVYELYKDQIFSHFEQKDIYIIEALEENKNIDTALKICERMTEIRAKRNSTIISFGGGIIQDITGFAANILYRGVKWIFIPTTLLAQVDSCIGGKTSLNHGKFKNLLGTFYPPDKLFIDMGFIETLTQKDFCSGLGEIVKFYTMSGIENFKKITDSLDGLLDRDKLALEEYVNKSLMFKKALIEEDEFDTGVRILLNYGHTFGHAIESVTDFAVPHGQGVAIGIIVVNAISKQRNMINEEMQKAIEKNCLRVVNVAVDGKCFDYDLLKSALKNDKKNQGNNLTAVLLKDDYSLIKVSDVQEEEIRQALQEVSKLFA